MSKSERPRTLRRTYWCLVLGRVYNFTSYRFVLLQLMQGVLKPLVLFSSQTQRRRVQPPTMCVKTVSDRQISRLLAGCEPYLSHACGKAGFRPQLVLHRRPS